MPHVWSIGGGKGGTGKSFFTGNLGLLLARQGRRTLIVDADLGAANLHTIVGVPNPARSLADFVGRRVASLLETAVPTPEPNLALISGAMNSLDMANIPHEQKARLLRHLLRLPYEYILLDLGAGTSYNTIDFYLVSEVGIFITTPEPTAIENIYRLIRSVYFRRIHQVLKTAEFRAVAEEARQRDPLATVSNPPLMLEVIAEVDPAKAALLAETLQAFRFKLVVNQLRRQDSPSIGPLICKIVGRHLGIKMDHAGNIAFDDAVHIAVCKKRPFLELYPHTQTALDLRQCCRQLLAVEGALPVLSSVGG